MLLALSPVAGTAAKDRACNVDEQRLLGYWKGDGQFEEMQFTKIEGVNVFSSWLHHRPEHSGAIWTFSRCKLSIVPRGDPEFSYEFTVRISRKALLLIDTSDESTSSYRRLPDPK